MCLVFPVKIVTIKNRKIIVQKAGYKREVSGSLTRVKVGDCVILKDNFIIRKISKKEAKEIINLIQNKR